MSADEFARRLKASCDKPDMRFAFFLGAGCSVSSGIPAAGTLVRDEWLPQLFRTEHSGQSYEAWLEERFPGYVPEKAAIHYGDAILALFPTERERQLEIERLCGNKHPGFAYGILAALLAREDGRFNVVLTTNFDDMLADALYLYTEARPLIVHHGGLAAFIEMTRTRPLIVKLHGDAHLDTYNTSEETRCLNQELSSQVQTLLRERGLIVMGYGGNDVGVRAMLQSLPPSALKNGIYWVSSEEPNEEVKAWLLQRNGVHVRGESFDLTMVRIRNEFEISPPSKQRFELIFENYQRTWERLRNQVAGVPLAERSASLKEAVERTEAAFESWWAVEEAATLASDDQARQAVYENGIQRFPRSAQLLGNYALFLSECRSENDLAQELYERALAIDPNQADHLGNYANFLKNVRGRHDDAQELYERAIRANPKHAIHLGNYALFLSDVRKEHDRAQELYECAIEADPWYAVHLGNYALFLADVRKEYDRAQEFYERAIEADPKNAGHLGNYASFLTDIRQAHEHAQELYRRAIIANPKHANNLGNYGQFLLEQGERGLAIDILRRSAALADPYPSLQLELWFYFFAHEIVPERSSALERIKGLLMAGFRSPAWNFASDIERARKADHPAGDWLAQLAGVISKDRSLDTLDGWPAWQRTEPSAAEQRPY